MQDDNRKFIPYGTMYKIESRSSSDIITDPNPRDLRCVQCNYLLEWRIYRIAPKVFDAECPECNVRACDFWKDKPHLAVLKE